MAGKDKTKAWESIKFIKSHYPLWEERGLKESFLDEIIKPKYKACSADVRSALNCDIMLFETLYNQPDFISLLKGICKKHRLPYGKVERRFEEKGEEYADIVFPEFKDISERPKRIDMVKKEKGFKSYSKIYEVVNKVKNKKELVDLILNKRNTVDINEGYRALKVDADMLEILIDFVEAKVEPLDQMRILNYKWESIQKYNRMLIWAGILIRIKNRTKKELCRVNTDIVEFEDGHKYTDKYDFEFNWEK